MKHTQKVYPYSTHLYKFYAQETRAKGSGITRSTRGLKSLVVLPTPLWSPRRCNPMDILTFLAGLS